ncbi:Uncharacterised nucleotidyltransferase [Burkholderiaceae bacterium]
MFPLLGLKKPDQLLALIDFCFSPDPASESSRLIDRCLQEDLLTGEQYRILPLMYGKTALERLSPSSISKVQSAYKHTFYRNHVLLNRASVLRSRLIERGFAEPVFLKGVPNCLRSASGIGSRPMVDVDLLIPDMHLKPDMVLSFFKEYDLKSLGSTVRSVTGESPEGFQFDFHWYLSDWAVSSSVVKQLVNSSECLSFRQVAFRVPCIEHHLVHVIGHGMFDGHLAMDARWVVDVLMLLQGRFDFSEDRIVDLTDQVQGRARIQSGLRLLAQHTPEQIQIDRDVLLAAADRIRPMSRGSTWLLDRKLITDSTHTGRYSKKDLIKDVLTTYIYTPFLLCRENRLPLRFAIGLVFGFPLEPISRCIVLFRLKVKKHFYRLFEV